MSRRPYVRSLVRTRWWLEHPRYFRYMMRELSSLFIGVYVLLVIVGIFQLSRGEVAYEAFRDSVEGPFAGILAIVTILFAVYHTYTWFQVTPKAMPLVIGNKRVHGSVIIAAHWLGFVFASAALWWLLGP